MQKRLKNPLKRLVSPAAIDKKASILILVLWAICFLAGFAIILGYGVRQKLALAYRLEERDKLRLVAEAGIKKAIIELTREIPESYAALADQWSNNPAVFKDIGISGYRVDICYNYLDEKSGLYETRYGLIDEERKININRAPRIVLERLFGIVLGFDEVKAQELAAAIVDWRDADSELSIPIGSAESAYYRSQKYPYEAKDSSFEVLRELLLVKGMDEEIFKKIKGYLTIYGNFRVNINTATKAVLLALGMSEDLAEKILLFRAGEDGIAGTSDDNIFDTPGNILPRLSQFYHLSASEIALLSTIVEQFLGANSNNFTVRCTAGLQEKKSSQEVISVIDRSGRILSWAEYAKN